MNPPQGDLKSHVDSQRVTKPRHISSTFPKSSQRYPRWKEKKKVAKIRKTVTMRQTVTQKCVALKKGLVPGDPTSVDLSGLL